jgi:hypothetical protein
MDTTSSYVSSFNPPIAEWEIERIARALYKSRSLRHFASDPETESRVMLESIREPTQAMLDAGNALYGLPVYTVEDVWKAMIDAQLAVPALVTP